MSALICISANVFEPPEIIADQVSRIGFWYSMAVLLLICIDQLCTHVRMNILKGKMNLKYNKKVTEDYKTWYSRLIMGTTANFKNQKNCSTPSVRINRSMQAKEYFVIKKSWDFTQKIILQSRNWLLIEKKNYFRKAYQVGW